MSFNPDRYFLERQFNGTQRAQREEDIKFNLINFKNQSSIIGKGPDATIDLVRNVERAQCVISFDRGVPYLRNLSNEGTWVNGNRFLSTNKMEDLRKGDLIGLQISPLNTEKDRNEFYVYKVCKQEIVEQIDITSDDDDEGYDGNISTASPSPSPGVQAAQARISAAARVEPPPTAPEVPNDVDDEQFSAVDYNEEENQEGDALGQDDVLQAIKDIDEVFDAISPPPNEDDSGLTSPSTSHQAEEAGKTKNDMLKEAAEEAKAKQARLKMITGGPKVQIIDAHNMPRRRGCGPAAKPAPDASIPLHPTVQQQPRMPKKRGRKSKAEKEELRKKELAELARRDNELRPEKKQRVIDNPLRVKMTTTNRSDALVNDLMEQRGN